MYVLQRLPPTERILTPQEFLKDSLSTYKATLSEIERKYQIVAPNTVRDWKEWATFPKEENYTNQELYSKACAEHNDLLSGLTIPETDDVHEYIQR
jgi:hypothetical protein